MTLEPGMWVLLMNDMRSANIENMQPVACAWSREELEGLIARETVEPYADPNESRVDPAPWSMHGTNKTWSKSFRKGGPLEWFNGGSAEFVQWFPEQIEVPAIEELSCCAS